ncbi:hypothetical protein SNA_20945 [Streptomyces natalensis ATCC 27448]|uniref:Uncharacterized protein n=1 Tax=Streptomyces natalensis ATCC 27448 TaxID=1240678 RepID=A0A0D7CHX9_9ACTN|nr:hypothetical protein SNA_20945 [Streptomyces natalensis ATCC 27448]
MGEFPLRSDKAHLESFHLAEPSFAFGFGDEGEEVLSDLDGPVTLGALLHSVDPRQGLTDADYAALNEWLRRTVGAPPSHGAA